MLDELLEYSASRLSVQIRNTRPMWKDRTLDGRKLKAAGADNVEVCPTEGHPIVYGDKIIDPSKPTVLVYRGHYDVQPADPA